MDTPGNITPVKFIHRLFIFALIAKGLNGLAEIASGIILLFIQPAAVSGLIFKLTQIELNEDPADLVANYFLRLGREFSVSSQIFGSFFLLSHGIIKIGLLLALWKRKHWAYPTALIVFGIFIVYQTYRFYLFHSAGLILLNLMDAAVMALTYWEYRRLKPKDV